MLPFWALTEVFFGRANGGEVVSAHIDLNGVSLGTTGISGGGFAGAWDIRLG